MKVELTDKCKTRDQILFHGCVTMTLDYVERSLHDDIRLCATVVTRAMWSIREAKNPCSAICGELMELTNLNYTSATCERQD